MRLLVKNLLVLAISFFIMQASAQKTWQYISPLPGSTNINPENNIAVRQGEILHPLSIDNSLISVEGTKSGIIKGKIKLSVDSRTLIFEPEHAFQLGEEVSVRVSSGILSKTGNPIKGLNFKFSVIAYDNTPHDQLFPFEKNIEHLDLTKPRSITGVMDTLYSYNDLITYGDASLPDDFPMPYITTFNKPSQQYTFYATEPETDKYAYYAVIMDNFGVPVFYRKWNDKAVNFQAVANDQLIHKNKLDNKADNNSFALLDNYYNIIDTLQVGNGYNTNTHDMILLPNGNRYMMIYDNQLVGMDTVVPGGDPDATVRGFVLQELDSEDNVVFQWRSWDHFDITDAKHVDLTAPYVDYVHINAYDTTADGNIILCCRHFDEITKIDRNTGDIIWRFGPTAKKNMFTFSNDTVGFSWPHDSRETEEGNITLFDNGNYHDPQYSRGMEYELDETNLTSTLVWEFAHDPVIYAKNKGGSLKLPNDNTIIAWGNNFPVIATEVNPAGEVEWEMVLDSTISYKTMKFNWTSSYFETSYDTIDYGYYDDYTPWPRIFTVTNNTDHPIQINSASNHLADFYLQTSLPLTIEAGQSEQMTIYFFPGSTDDFMDVLTLNYDSYYADTLDQRISRQIVLMGTTIPPTNLQESRKLQTKLFPNPCKEKLHLQSEDQFIESVSIRTSDSREILLLSGLRVQDFNVDMRAYPAGFYMVEIQYTGSDQKEVLKFIKK